MTPNGKLRSEAGLSLVEVLVTVSLLGIAIVTIVSGLGTASVASDHHRKQVTADTVVRSYAEVIKQRTRGGGYRPCASASDYAVPASAGWAPPTGYSVSITKIEYWQAPGALSTTCPLDQGAQRLSLQARSSDGRDTEALQTIVRAP